MHRNRGPIFNDATKGIIARVLFGIVGVCGVMLTTMITKSDWYWLLALILLLLIAEGIATMKTKKKWKCLVPCLAICMLMVVPSVIIMEFQMDMLDTRQVDKMKSEMSNMSMTEMNIMMSMPMQLQQQEFAEENLFEISNMSPSENNSDLTGSSESRAVDMNMNMSAQSLEMYLRMKVALLCPEEAGCTWDNATQIFKQIFIMVLIIGLWLDPNTKLTKKEKAELLLINFGAAFDVLEFLEMQNGVRKKLKASLIDVPCLLPATLITWTWSLLQFALVFKPEYFQRKIDLSSNSCIAKSAFWEAFISLLLMEIPYLAFRLMMIFYFGCIEKSIIFFAIKNLFIILMQIYRLYALQTDESITTNAEHDSTELQHLNDA